MPKTSIIVAALAFAAVAPVRAQMTVYPVDGLTRVGPDAEPQVLASLMFIRAARNEYEPFQVVVHANDRRLTRVHMEITDFRSRDGVIPRANVTFYREHYVQITRSTQGAPEAAGWFADALIPFVIPSGVKQIKKPRFVGAPFDVEAGKNQPVWIDVYVPHKTPRGVYDATVTVKADGIKSQTVPVQLTVWDMTLPDLPSMRSDFGKLSEDIAIAYGVEMNSEAFLIPEWHYAEALSAHRISPIVPNTRYPRVADDGSIDPARTHARLVAWMERFRPNGFRVRLLGDDPTGRDRQRNLTHLRAMWAYLKKYGWEKLAYVYVFDEPETKKDYSETRARSRLVHEAVPELKVLCAEQTKTENPEWGELIGFVDIWASSFAWYDDVYTARCQQEGDEIWSYTALAPDRRMRRTPVWQIDFPLLEHRIPFWLNYRYDVKGILYWRTVVWSVTKDMWTDPVTYIASENPYNGDGALLYPGIDAGINGAITSIRLKQIREGFEDYEYFKLAEARGYRKFAEDTVREIARSWTSWDPRPQALYDARGALARHIVSGE